ncbi:hypothetical protein QWJ34_03785 [Saccharibacillus sp. CPCC 101409]|uniref:hypothetical protein n=1 Tax=Saccharibacillus sp. CPCC 101409 TaxID=3058041 RepID=UPI002673050D|nr:hypothetical protein [Saccharibacillus sp. CPCC 101409]MDO3408880.1 hypothetical protein [Saccharibacillus sp. CPCC 101409]
MLKLLKYDLKRDGYLILGVAAALALLQLFVEIGGRYRGAEDEMRIVFSIFSYVMAALLVVIKVCQSFLGSVRSAGRRLLPLRTFHFIGAGLLYGVLLMAALGVLGMLQLAYYMHTGMLGVQNISASGMLALLLSGGWTTIFLLLSFFLIMTVSESLRFKGRYLAAVLIYFILGSTISWVENGFLGGQVAGMMMFGARIQNPYSIIVQSSGFVGSWPALVFELLLAAVFCGIIVKLIERRIEAA